MASQITATLPALDFPREVDYPTQEDWAAFSAAAELNFGILGGDWSTQMQLWKTQANTMSTELNTNATIAQGLANYQGDWTSKGYTLNQTVSVGGIYYICKLTHATGQNPTTGGSIYWNLALGNWSLKADKIEVALKIDKDISPYTSKTTPIDSDLIPLSDSASSFGIKKLTWANLKATLSSVFAPLNSPAFTGSPTAPTQTAGDNSTRLATTAYVNGKMVLRTSVACTGNTSIDFTSIPSWVKRVTISLAGLSLVTTDSLLIKLGSGGVIQSTGYNGGSSIIGTTVNSANYTTGIGIRLDTVLATATYEGKIECVLHDNSNTWICSGIISLTSPGSVITASRVTLSGNLDTLRLTTLNGISSFDSGFVNILYEG